MVSKEICMMVLGLAAAMPQLPWTTRARPLMRKRCDWQPRNIAKAIVQTLDVLVANGQQHDWPQLASFALTCPELLIHYPMVYGTYRT